MDCPDLGYMKAGNEIGYVALTRDLDASGLYHLSIIKGTHIRFQRAVEEVVGTDMEAGIKMRGLLAE